MWANDAAVSTSPTKRMYIQRFSPHRVTTLPYWSAMRDSSSRKHSAGTRGKRAAWLALALFIAPSVASAQGEAEPPVDDSAAGAPEPVEPPPPSTPESQEEALATELFNRGKQLSAEGKHAEACPKFAESAKLDPRVGTLGQLAACEERLQHLVSARAHWQQAANLARAQGDQRLSLAEKELTRIDAMVPKVRIVIPSDAPREMTIRLDQLQVGLSSIGVPIPLDPGSHTITVLVSGKPAWNKTVQLRANGAVTPIEIPMLDENEDADAPAGPTAPPVAGSSTGTMTTVGVVAGGVGIVGLAVGAYFGGVAQAKLDDSNDLGCTEDNSCPEPAAERRDDARTAGDLSTIFFLAGGALLAGGITLWILDDGDDSPSVGATVTTGPSASGLSLHGAF